MHGHGANFSDYQKAFSSVKHSTSSIIPASGLTDNNLVPLREAGETINEYSSPAEEKRKLGNIIMKVNNYSFLTCVCGMKLKIPPGFGTNKPEIICPRCGNVNKVNHTASVRVS